MRLAALAFALLILDPVPGPASAEPAQNPLLRSVSCNPNEVTDRQSLCMRKCADLQRRCGDSYANTKEACEAKYNDCVKACGCGS